MEIFITTLKKVNNIQGEFGSTEYQQLDYGLSITVLENFIIIN